MRGTSFLRVFALAAGMVGACVAGAGAASAAMTFRLATAGEPATCGAKCPQIIIAEGEIVERTPSDFVNFLRANRSTKNIYSVVMINSPGGRVVASMELGRLLRKAGAAVIVARAFEADGNGGMTRFAAARCYSACVYALMGAKKRVVPPQSKVGIHRMFLYERMGQTDGSVQMTKTFAQSEMVNRLGDYAGMMGVSRDLVYSAEKTPPDTFHVLTPAEIRRWRLASEKF